MTKAPALGLTRFDGHPGGAWGKPESTMTKPAPKEALKAAEKPPARAPISHVPSEREMTARPTGSSTIAPVVRLPVDSTNFISFEIAL